MPHPKPGEQKNLFIRRCIPLLIHEGYFDRQAIAICYSIWRRENKK